jgi:hypothetical protein
MITLSHELSFASIISTFFNCSSKSEILSSTAACSFLASSYSEFSDKSQNDIASFSLLAISTLLTSFSSSNSCFNFSKPSFVTKTLFHIFFYNLFSKKQTNLVHLKFV